MRLIKIFMLSTLLGVLMGSCIQDEAPNSEADILNISFQESILANSYINLDAPYNESLKSYPIQIRIKEGINLSSLAPIFELTPGATIQPASGSIQNFTTPVKYTVTSEDKKWERVYTITIKEQKATNIPTSYHFEDVRLIKGISSKDDPDKKLYYDEFYEIKDGEELTWASGNAGFNLAMSEATTNEYPTSQYADGKIGKCAKLETRTTGSLGALVKMPIAAGNLFIGSFDIKNAINNPLSATRFGISFYNKPVRLTGYYKYKAGERFYENGGYTNRKDMFNIYAIFYETSKDTDMLDGNLANQNYESPNMVALALISNPHETNEWEFFDIPFNYERYGKTIDAAKLARGEYKISLIFASSKDGALFQGAPGSTLLIDEVELIYE